MPAEAVRIAEQRKTSKPVFGLASSSNTGCVRLYLYSAGLLLACGGLVLVAALTAHRSRFNPTTLTRFRGRQNLALVAAAAAIVAITLLPTHGESRIRLTPLEDIGDAFTPRLDRFSLIEVAGNVFLFVPLGAALRFRGLGLGNAALAGGLSSTALEIAQFVVPGRTTSFDDALLNTLGVILGYSVGAASAFGFRER